MKRLLIAWLCAVLAALGAGACDQLKIRELKPGVSSALEVRDRFGPPQMEWRNADGSVTWEYSRQPEGTECFMITIGPDRILRRIDQVLNDETFGRVERGMVGDEVRRLLGRPAASQFFQLKQETVWEWLIERSGGDRSYFTVTFNTDGRVVGSGRYLKPGH